jgi:uncharacterized membrane protein
MATPELESKKQSFLRFLTGAINQDQIQEQNLSALDKIWKQRHEQRDKLFEFSVKLTWYCFIFLVCVVYFQIWSQLLLRRDLLTGYELQILSVAVFGQIIAIVGIITKSIWDDKIYSGLLDKDHSRKHRSDYLKLYTK